MFGPFVDKTDGVTLKTDATTITDIDHATTGIFVSKAGAAAAIRSQAVTASVADAYGMMKVTLSATDTNTIGTLDVLFAKAATYLPVHKEFTVLDEAVYDVLFGTTALATTTNITAGTVTTATNVTTVNGLAANVITAAAIADGAIDAATFAADVDAEILSYIVDDATRIDASSLNTASVTTIPAILVDTAEIGVAGAGLTAINLPDQTMNITGNITGNLSGSVGSVTGAVGSVTGAVGSVTGAVGSVTGLTASDVGAIKTQTDKLVFTVANQVDANIQYVNDVAVTGTGAAGTPWGP